jgi:hypothetical protein
MQARSACGSKHGQDAKMRHKVPQAYSRAEGSARSFTAFGMTMDRGSNNYKDWTLSKYFVFLSVLCGLYLLESKRQAATQRASGLDHVDGASILAHHRDVTLRQQVAQVKQRVHSGGDE